MMTQRLNRGNANLLFRFVSCETACSVKQRPEEYQRKSRKASKKQPKPEEQPRARARGVGDGGWYYVKLRKVGRGRLDV